MKRKYGYRKFKGIGLAAAVIGFAFLSAPIYASELSTDLETITETSSTTVRPQGTVVARGEDGVPWELYENGYLLFKPVAGKDTLRSGYSTWKMEYGAKIKYIGFAGKTYAPVNSSYLFSKHVRTSTSSKLNFDPLAVDITNLDTRYTTDMGAMFYGLSKVQHLDVSHFDTSKVTNMHSMFSGTYQLLSLNLSNFDTRNVTNMDSMFASASSLKTLDLSSFRTTNVTDMSHMFQTMDELVTLNVSSFDTRHVTDMQGMFGFLPKLTSLDVSHFDTSNVTDMGGMFAGLEKITRLDLSHLDTRNVTAMAAMFANTKLTSLNLSNFDTRNVNDMGAMFSGMTELIYLILLFNQTQKCPSCFIIHQNLKN